MLSKTDSTRVIIIGAGPVGLCLALRLAQFDIPTTIFESLSRDNFLNQVPRAGTNHPATLEMYDQIGLYEKLEPRGYRAPLFHYWDRSGPTMIAEFDHALLKEDTKFPFVLQCERIKIVEVALEMALANPHCTVLMDTTFTGFTQTSDGVMACGQTGDGDHVEAHGTYVVSAEGARSLIRKELDIEFEGFTYPDRTLNIEVVYDFKNHGYADRNYISDPHQWSNLFRWGGPPERWRVHFPTDPDASEQSIMSQENMQNLLQGFLPKSTPYEILGSNLYTVHQRVATSFRKGRALLAGDSAHVNSPIGGMGLNSGIHDAFNLAEKLVQVIRGEADDTLLDRYDRQRRTIAVKHTQAQTIRNKKLLMEKDEGVRRKNQDELRRTAENPELARQFLLRTALFLSVREASAIA